MRYEEISSANRIFLLTLHRTKTIPSLVASYVVSSVDAPHRFGSAGKRNQAKQYIPKATHSGSAHRALPEVFLPNVHAPFVAPAFARYPKHHDSPPLDRRHIERKHRIAHRRSGRASRSRSARRARTNLRRSGKRVS